MSPIRDEVKDKNRKFYYAKGFTLAQCRKVCKYMFGAFLLEVKANNAELRFDIYIYNEIEHKDKKVKIEELIDIKDFEDYWCSHNEWKLIRLNREDIVEKDK